MIFFICLVSNLCVALIDYYAVHLIFLPPSVRSRNDLLLNGTYLFPAPRQDTAPSPSCPVYDDGNTFLEFNCEFEPGRMRQHYLLIWREIPISGGSRIVSGSGLTGFSADTDDFSLRVDLSVVKDIGSFFCRVEVPKCVESLSSPDNISGSCAKSILPGMEQKVPPNYCELVSVKLACERCGVSHSAVTRGYVCILDSLPFPPSPSLPPPFPHFLPHFLPISKPPFCAAPHTHKCYGGGPSEHFLHGQHHRFPGHHL